MSHAVRIGDAVFRPRARLLKLLGAELISDDVVAIMELVKNAHDADASSVTVEFRNLTSKNAEIVIRDDGVGMDLDALLTYWMEPGGSSKAKLNGHMTARGRRVLGEKGVGRFAADKLARHLELISRHAGETDELVASFDWDQFEAESSLLSDIKQHWELRPAAELAGHGTILRMTGLRSQWNERMFRRLSTRLSRLRSPFREIDDFKIRIESDDFPDYSGDLRSDILDRAPYRIEAAFDGDRVIEIRMNGARPARHEWNGEGVLECGPVRARIYAFDLETEAIARIGPRMEVRAWLKEWSGVSVYRDRFRVWPYGEPHDDWLRLDQRRVNTPVVRLSQNQVVGFVEISRDRNPDLRDQTSREGFQSNRAFEDLRRLLYFVLQVLEAERQSVRHPKNGGSSKPARPEHDALSIAGALEKLASRTGGDIAAELRRLARRLGETRDRDHGMQQRLLEGYSELAALGQTVSVISMSLKPLLPAMRKHCDELRARMNGGASRETTDHIQALTESVAAAERRLSMLLENQSLSSGRRRPIDVVTELRRCRELLEPILETVGIHMKIRAPRSGLVRIEMRPENFHRVMYILAMNSIEWLRGRRRPTIEVRVRTRGGDCEVIFADNGRGISSQLVGRVFEPLFSRKEGGRGMGLTIAKSIITLHRGEIAVVPGGGPGTALRIVLPRKRSRATRSTA